MKSLRDGGLPWAVAFQAGDPVHVALLGRGTVREVRNGGRYFVDVKGKFWPFGGLLQQDMQPKEAYHRLLKLKQTWGLAKAT